MNFLCFKPPTLWYLVTAAGEKECTCPAPHPNYLNAPEPSREGAHLVMAMLEALRSSSFFQLQSMYPVNLPWAQLAPEPR